MLGLISLNQSSKSADIQMEQFTGEIIEYIEYIYISVLNYNKRDGYVI